MHDLTLLLSLLSIGFSSFCFSVTTFMLYKYRKILVAISRLGGALQSSAVEKRIQNTIKRKMGEDLLKTEPILNLISTYFPSVGEYLQEHPEYYPIALALLKRYGFDAESLIKKFLASQNEQKINKETGKKLWGMIYGKKKKD